MSDKVPHGLVVRRRDEMAAFASRIAAAIYPGDIILLSGELGAGKTTFVKMLAHLLGVREDVTSPTFTVITEYIVQGHPDFTKIVHADLYRLTPEQTVGDPHVQELLETSDIPGQLTCIEWADRLGPSIPIAAPVWRILFEHGETESERLITVKTWPHNRNWH